jgi:hypothetical protein
MGKDEIVGFIVAIPLCLIFLSLIKKAVDLGEEKD